jgi:hypothetical protein
VVTTIAGGGTAGAYADGSGTDARFYQPMSVAIDATGNMFSAEYSNNRIRKIAASGGTRISPVTLRAFLADTHVGALA